MGIKLLDKAFNLCRGENMESEECVPVKATYKAIKISEELGDKVRKAFVTARRQDDLSTDDNPVYTWKTIYKFHGIVWSELFGFYFLANYGTKNQGPHQPITLNDRIIETPFGEQFLLSEEEYQRYFSMVK